MPKTCFNTEKLPPPIGPYSHATIANGFAFVSGLLGLHRDFGQFFREGAAGEAERILELLSKLVTELGSDLRSIVKVTIYLRDMADFGAVNEVYQQYFGEEPPARVCVAVAGLPKDATVEMDAIIAL
jgi:2-iminobutanoate/2-iminopropanoate deaminase